MYTNSTRKNVISESVFGFERAGARIEVNVDVPGCPNSTLPFDKLLELSKGEPEKMKVILESQNGIPFKYDTTITNGGYLVTSSITYDPSSNWGKLLDDAIISLLLKNGFATWVFTGEGGIKFNDKITKKKLESLNILPAEIYNHPLHDYFYTPTGKKITKKNFLKILSRNK